MNHNQEISSSGMGMRIARVGGWTVAGQFISRLMDIALLAILGRILTPADFGFVAKATVFIAVIEGVTGLPITQAILRVKDPPRSMYDTAITLGFLRGLVIALVMLAAAWPIALLYGEPGLFPVLLALALSSIIRGVMNPKAVELTRRFIAAPGAIIGFISVFVSSVIGIVAAIITQSYWSLVVVKLSGAFIQCILTYYIMPYMPRFSLKNASAFTDIIGWNFLGSFIGSFTAQIDRFILSARVPLVEFGRYTIASNISTIPSGALAGPISRALLASFTHATSRDHLQMIWLKASATLLVLVAPFLIALTVMAKPAVLIVMGPQWIEAAGYVAILSLGTLPTLPTTSLNDLAAVTYRARIIAIFTACQFGLSLSVLLVAVVFWGIWGVVVARLVINLVLWIISAVMVRQVLDVSLLRQWRALQGCVMALVLMGIVMQAFSFLWHDLNQSIFILLLNCILVFALGCIVYIAVLMGWWHISKRPDSVEATIWNMLATGWARFRTKKGS